MSVYLSFDGGEPMDLASNQGWADVAAWSEALSPDSYYYLLHLIDHGWSEDLASVEEQLAKAMQESPPDKDDVKKTLEHFAATIKDRGAATVATIDNGMSPAE